jgi:hypothetical protein
MISLLLMVGCGAPSIDERVDVGATNQMVPSANPTHAASQPPANQPSVDQPRPGQDAGAASSSTSWFVPARPETISQNEVVDATGDFVLWIPPGVQRIQGIVYLNMPKGAYAQEGAQRQLASTWGFAHLTGMAWNNNLPHTFDIEVDLLEQRLSELSTASGHAELRTVPLVAVGLSRTGGTGFALARKWNNRVVAHAMIAAAFPKGPAVESAGVPSISIVGDQDNYDAALSSFLGFRPKEGGMLVATAINRGVGHKCGPCNQVLWPFLDRVIRQRIHDGALRSTDLERAWVGDVKNWRIAPLAAASPALLELAWLPDRSVALAWEGFTAPTPEATFTSPRNDLGAISKAKAGTVTIEVTYAGSPEDDLMLFDQDAELGALPKGPSPRTMTVTIQPGLHVFLVLKNGRSIARPVGGLYLPST